MLPSRRGLAALAALAVAGPARAQPQPWPDRPVRAVVPFGPGGAIDILARVMAPYFPAEAGGQPLVVDNRPGAGGTIGATLVAQAKPDGTTLLMAELGATAIAHTLYRGLPYDPRQSFTPIIFLADLPMVLVVRQNLPARDLPGLLAMLRDAPAGISFGTVGTGHISQLTAVQLGQVAGPAARLLQVTYRSGADMVAAVAKGECDFTVTSVSSATPFLQSGGVRAMAVSTAAPIAALPGVPTMASIDPALVGTLWYGLVGPAGMDPALVGRINAVFNAILAKPEVRDTLARQQGAEVIGGPPEAFAAHLRAETARWAPVVQAAGIRVE
jgi:tripartite-type tricarboxylate transporter receptor subunit TctC